MLGDVGQGSLKNLRESESVPGLSVRGLWHMLTSWNVQRVQQIIAQFYTIRN